jgi:hypothetical protein
MEFMGKENNLDVGDRIEALNETFGNVAVELKGLLV